MPKHATEVPFSLDGRRRITVDLDREASEDLQYILDWFQAVGRATTMSEVVRRAISRARVTNAFKWDDAR